MKRFKKAMAAALAISLSATALSLTGCAKQTPKTSSAPKQTAPYQITWYLEGNGMSPDVPAVEKQAAALTKNLNITLNLQYIDWGDYNSKMSMIIQSGQPFDMCFTASSSNYYSNASKGAFIDLTNDYTQKFPKFSKVLNPVFTDAAKVNGKLYALATNKEAFEAYGFDVDTKLAKEAGVDISKIKTLADMGNALAAVKQKIPSITPLFMEQSYALPFERSFDQIGDNNTPGIVFMDDSSAKVVDQYETPEMMNIWKTVYSWMNAGYINKDAATTTDETLWDQGKAFARPQWGIGVLPTWIDQSGDTIQRVYIGDFTATTNADTGAMIAFSRTSKNADKAMAFFDQFATDPDLLNLICYGIEGKDYQITDKSTNPQREDYMPGQSGSTAKYTSGGAWSIGGDYFNSYLGPTDPANRNQLIQQENTQAKKSPVLGFSFDPSSVQNEISACNNVVAQYYYGLSTGTLDPTKYAPTFISALKAAGSDKIVAAKQSQIDAWKKATANS